MKSLEKVIRHMKVAFTLLLSKLIIYFFSFKKIANYLNRQDFKPYSLTDQDKSKIRAYSKSIGKMAKHLPGEYNCFAKSLTAIFLLRHSFPATIYFGVKTVDHEIKAHAWVKIEDMLVVGGQQHKEYHVIKRYI